MIKGRKPKNDGSPVAQNTAVEVTRIAGGVESVKNDMRLK